MTEEQLKKNHEILKTIEKPFYKSKKFWAWFLQEAALVIMAIFALKWQENLGWPLSAFMLGIVFTMGFAYLSYNGKQAMVEAYTRGIALTGEVPGKLAKKIKKSLPGGDPEKGSDES